MWNFYFLFNSNFQIFLSLSHFISSLVEISVLDKAVSMFLRKLGKDHQIISRKDGQSTFSINHQADILHRFNRNSIPYLIYFSFVIHECFSLLLISSCQCTLRVRHVKILSHVINQSAKFFDFTGTTVLEFTWKFQIQLIRSVFT